MDFIDAMTTSIGNNWLFLALALIFAVIGQVAKATIFSDDAMRKHKSAWWGRKTLPLHPVVAGAFVATLPGMPFPPAVDTLSARVIYCALAGVVSTWAFAAIKSLAKKQGIDLASIRPPPIPITRIDIDVDDDRDTPVR